MKSVNLIPMSILSVVLSSCTHEPDHLNAVAQDATYSKMSGIAAGNTANPYDDVGQTYKDLLISYKFGNYAPKDYGAVVKIVTILTGRPVSATLQGTLATIISNPEVAANSILSSSELSTAARNIVSGLIEDYDRLSAQPFDTTFNEITVIESGVLSNPALPAYDRRVLLSLTSVTRYALYHSCCEDTDWEKSVGNIVAALAGTLENNADGVTCALVTSIAGLEKIQL